MQFKVDDVLVYELADWQLALLGDAINRDELAADLRRRLEWVFDHKLAQCYKRLFDKWYPILEADPTVVNIPVDKAAFVQMIMARPDYLDRKDRDTVQGG